MAAEQRKLTSAFLAETDPLRPNAFLYYMPLGTEVIDDGGTTIWTDSPGFAAVKARILRPPLLSRISFHSCATPRGNP